MKPKHTLRRGRRHLLQGLATAVCLGLGAVLVPALLAPAFAQPTPPPDVEVIEYPIGPVNQRQALERVRAQFPGNVISINEVVHEERVRYRIRIDNDGNIYTVFVDQATGVVSRE